MLTPICLSRVAVNLFPHRCVTSCGFAALTECMPGFYPDTLHRMDVCGCRNNTPLRFSTLSKSERLLLFLAGRRAGATWDSCNIGSHRTHKAEADLQIRGSVRALCHHHHHFPGGAKR